MFKLEVLLNKLLAIDPLPLVLVWFVKPPWHMDQWMTQWKDDPSKSLLAGVQGQEILGREGDDVRAELHDKASDKLATNAHFKVHLGS